MSDTENNKNSQDSQSWVDVGEQIKNVVQSALDSGDFKELNKTVSLTVNKAIAEASYQMKNVAQEVKANAEKANNAKANKVPPKFKSEQYFTGKKTTNTTPYNSQYVNYPVKQSYASLVKMKSVGSVSGVLMIVFGAIGCGSAFMGIMNTILNLVFGKILIGALLPNTVLLILGFICCIGLIQRGVNKRERLSRANRYVNLAGGKMYIDIKDLVQHTGKKAKYLVKDIKKMLKLGIFQEGHFDEKQTCIMFNDVVYHQYLTLKEENKQIIEDTPAKQPEEKVSPNSELEIMIEEGNDYIKKLRELNDIIEGEVISDKLFQLEAIIKEIFERVKKQPEQMSQMYKFMNYYLPTTLKLVQAYADFDEVSVPGPEILSAKAEIEQTLDTINRSFGELLNNLFQDVIFDVTTDAQVLQTMLAQEGLHKGKKIL